jgi:hypothetical protein
MEMNSNKIVSILGLPRQGTTLISGIFNTPPNFFSAVEPHWSKICGLEISSGNKIPIDLLSGHHPSMVIPLLKQHLENSDHLGVCSIKETYRHQEKECCDYLINSDLVDVHLFIYRNPLFGFNGWKKARWDDWYNQVQNYKDCYISLHNESLMLEKTGKNVCRITYENICKPNVTEYLNSKLKQFGVFFQSDMHSIIPLGTRFGDPRASGGGPIGQSSDSVDFLHQFERDSLADIRSEIYDTL